MRPTPILVLTMFLLPALAVLPTVGADIEAPELPEEFYLYGGPGGHFFMGPHLQVFKDPRASIDGTGRAFLPQWTGDDDFVAYKSIQGNLDTDPLPEFVVLYQVYTGSNTHRIVWLDDAFNDYKVLASSTLQAGYNEILDVDLFAPWEHDWIGTAVLLYPSTGNSLSSANMLLFRNTAHGQPPNQLSQGVRLGGGVQYLGFSDGPGHDNTDGRVWAHGYTNHNTNQGNFPQGTMKKLELDASYFGAGFAPDVRILDSFSDDALASDPANPSYFRGCPQIQTTDESWLPISLGMVRAGRVPSAAVGDFDGDGDEEFACAMNGAVYIKDHYATAWGANFDENPAITKIHYEDLILDRDDVELFRPTVAVGDIGTMRDALMVGIHGVEKRCGYNANFQFECDSMQDLFTGGIVHDYRAGDEDARGHVYVGSTGRGGPAFYHELGSHQIPSTYRTDTLPGGGGLEVAEIGEPAMLVKGRERRLVPQDPLPLALVGAPPVIRGLGQDTADAPEFGDITTKGSSKGEGGGETDSTSAHGSVGFEIADVGVSTTTEYTMDELWTEATAQIEQLTVTDLYEGSFDDHTLIYSARFLAFYDFEVVRDDVSSLNPGDHYTYVRKVADTLGSNTIDEFVRLQVDSQFAPQSGYPIAGDFDVNEFMHATPGDPRTYMAEEDIEDYCDSKPIKSKLHIVDAGSSRAEGAAIELISEEEKSETTEITTEITQSAEGGWFGNGGGGSTTLDSNVMFKEETYSAGTGQAFSAKVGDIPDPEMDEETYAWGMFVCKKDIPLVDDDPLEVWVQNYWVAEYEGLGPRSVAEPVVPIEPTLLEPTGPSPELRWESQEGVTEYEVEVENLRTGVIARERTTDDSLTFTFDASFPLESGQAYRWRVIARDSFGIWDEYGAWAGFTPYADEDVVLDTPVKQEDVSFLVTWRGKAPAFHVTLGSDAGNTTVSVTGNVWRTPPLDQVHNLTVAPVGTDGAPDSVPIDPARNAPPVPSIVPVPVANALQPVEFRAIATDVDGHVVALEWDLGDGNTSTASYIAHAYQEPGTYTVTLTATDDDGEIATTSYAVHVLNNAPVVEGVQVDGRTAREPLTLTADAQDIDGAVEAYEWDIDGETFTGPNAEHAFPTVGNHTVHVKVQDDDGAWSDLFAWDVVIDNEPPEPDFLVPGGEVYHSLQARIDDVSRDDHGVVRSVWSIDGEEVSASTAQGPMYFTPDGPGTIKIGLTVTDTHGIARTLERDLEVHNHAPVASFELPPRLRVNERILPTDGSSDPDGVVAQHLWTLTPIALEMPEVGIDETPVPPSLDPVASAGPIVVMPHVPGRYDLRLDVADQHGATGSVNRTIRVQAAPLTAGIHADPMHTVSGEPVVLRDTSYGGVAPVTTEWDVDGASPDARLFEMAWPEPGHYVVRLNATDGVSKTSTTVTIEVRNRPPDIEAEDMVIIRDGVMTFGPGGDVDVAISDLDGTVAKVVWTLGDESSEGPAFVHEFTDPAAHLLRVAATDDDGATSTHLVAIHVARQRQVEALVAPYATHVVDDGETGLAFAADGRGGDLSVSIRTSATVDATDAGFALPGALRFLQVDPEAAHTADRFPRITIRMTYDTPVDNEEDLAIYYWNGEAWYNTRTATDREGNIPGVGGFALHVYDAWIDLEGQAVYAVVNHTSTYALASTPTAVSTAPAAAGGGGGAVHVLPLGGDNGDATDPDTDGETDPVPTPRMEAREITQELFVQEPEDAPQAQEGRPIGRILGIVLAAIGVVAVAWFVMTRRH